MEALAYLQSMSLGMLDDRLIEAYVDAGPEMVTFMEEHSPVRFQVVQCFPDYHPEHPGGKTGGGRSLECPVFSFLELGEWGSRVTVGRQMNGNMTLGEGPLGGSSGFRRWSCARSGVGGTNAATARRSLGGC